MLSFVLVLVLGLLILILILVLALVFGLLSLIVALVLLGLLIVLHFNYLRKEFSCTGYTVTKEFLTETRQNIQIML